jgi:hypothetical protein
MNLFRATFALVIVLLSAGRASAATVTGIVLTNLCSNSLNSDSSYTFGTYRGTCTSGNSTCTVSADTVGSGTVTAGPNGGASISFGATITAVDQDVDLNASGNFGYAGIIYQNEITLSQAGVLSFTFDVNGTPSPGNNGDYALYEVVGAIDGLGVFGDQSGSGSGAVTITTGLEDQLPAGTYDLTLDLRARFCLFNCVNLSEASVVEQTIRETSDYFNTFQLVGVTNSGGGTVIGADGTNFTALAASPEPSSFAIGLGGVLVVLGRLWFTARRRISSSQSVR